MKSIYALIAVSLLIVGAAVWLTVVMLKQSDILMAYALDIKTAAASGDEADVRTAVERFSELWDKAEHYWEIMSDHNDLDEISELLIELRYSMEENEMRVVEENASLIILYIQSIREKEIPRIENII